MFAGSAGIRQTDAAIVAATAAVVPMLKRDRQRLLVALQVAARIGV